MGEVLKDIQDGTWAAKFIADQDAGAPDFTAKRAAAEAHPIEETGPPAARADELGLGVGRLHRHRPAV